MNPIQGPTEQSSDFVEVSKDSEGEWRWHRKAANGEIVSTSGEGYKRRKDADEAARKYNTGIDDVRFV